MGALTLSSRAIVGEYYSTLEQDLGASWVGQVSNLFDSNQESETYKWLGQAPTLREWIGGRQERALREAGVTIANKRFEAMLEVSMDEVRRDKTGQVMVRVRELAERTNSHWAKLLTDLLIAGESSVCYDGQFYFDTDHVEGESGAQSNDLTLDITTPAAPTAGEMETAILKSMEAIMGFKDDVGEPMNENARSFLVMVPIPFMSAAAGAIGSEIIVDASTSRTNRILTLGSLGGFQVQLAVNARLPWTTKLATFRTDGATRGLIRQEEEAVMMKAIAEGSEEEIKNDRHLYSVTARRNVGFGHWQRAALTTFV
jgi:phage major head subunit gpT-like protein